MYIFKWPQCYSINWAIENARATEQALGQTVAYYHITGDANCVMDDMTRWALEARATITFWDSQVPEDVSGNYLQDVYEQQGMNSWLDWLSLPEPFDQKTSQSDPQPDIAVAVVFGQRYVVRVVKLYIWEA